MKSILAAILLIAQFSIPAYAKPPVIDRTLRSIVTVTYTSDDAEPFLCTGFVVNAAAGQVITALHCVATDNVIYVDGDPAMVIKVNGQFALLKTIPMKKPPVEFRSKPLVPGDAVLSFGYGYGSMKIFARKIAGLMDGDLALDGPLVPGMSGGPVVDLDGKIVGLNQASSSAMGVACGVEEMKDFLGVK